MKRISVKISLMITAVAILGIAVASVFIYFNVIKTVRDSVAKYQLEDARLLMKEIDRTFASYPPNLKHIGKYQAVADFLHGAESDPGKVADLFAEESKIVGNAHLFLLDPEGNYAFGRPESAMADAMIRQQFERCREDQNNAISEAFLEDGVQRTGSFLVIMSPVLEEPEHRLIGFIGGVVDVAEVGAGLKDSTIFNHVHLLDRQGRTLFMSDLEAGDGRSTEQQAAAVSGEAEGMIRKALAGQEGTELIQSLHGGYRSLTSYVSERGYRDFSGNGWILVAENRAGDIFDPAIRSLYFLIGVFTLIVLVGATVCVLFVYRVVTKPIGEISHSIGQISPDNLKEIKVGSNDEIGSLARSINHMIYELRALYQTMEEKVQEKTRDLDEKVGEMEYKNREMEDAQRATMNILEDSRELEFKLQDERDRSAAIIESMGEGLYVVDEYLNVVMLNSAAKRHFGIEMYELGKLKIEDVYQPLKKNQVLPSQEHPATFVMNNKTSRYWDLSQNISFQTKDGKNFPVVVIANPLFKEGKVVGAVVVFRDVTEEKKLDDAKTNFISVASHQLRTPLTSMRWFTEMLLDDDMGKISKEQREFVNNIYQSIRQMIDLVNLLLQIARVEAGRLKIEPAPIDLVQFIGEVAKSMDLLLKNKKQKVEIEVLSPQIPVIPLDKEMVWQVIQNLISNANRYGFEKSSIRVGIKADEKMVEVSVANEGIGIPKNRQEKIFEKFFRAENAVRSVPEGSGLGLSLARTLVEGWGGSVWFTSELNKETVFYFTIPVAGMKARGGEVGLKV